MCHYDGIGYTKYPSRPSITFTITNTEHHAIMGLTSDPDDTIAYEHGHYVMVLPNMMLFIMGEPTMIYKSGDTITLAIEGDMMKAYKNDELLHTWNDVTQAAMHAKIFLMETGSSLSVSDETTTGPPTYFEMTVESKPASVQLPCSTTCSRDLTQHETTMKNVCEGIGGEVVICDCYVLLCSKNVDAALLQAALFEVGA